MSTTKEALIDFTAGSIGGTCCAYVGQPLDTIKVKIQTYPHLYKNAFTCGLDTVRREGFFRLWAGVSPAVVANIGENSILFLCYGQCSKVVANICGTDKDKMTILQKACSGSFAGFFCTFALCPLELIKCRMQTLREFKGTHVGITPFTIVKDVLRMDGPLGFYRGILSTILREVPGYFLFFGGYEGTKYMLTGPGEDRENLGILKTVIAGGMGGVFLWCESYPIDAVKSRIQVYSANGKNYKFLEVCRKMAKEGGVRAFYRGIGPALLRAFPANGALFVGYEYSKLLFEKIA